MEARITKRLVDQVRPGDKEVMVFDTALKGFILRITPAGTRTYAVRYRMGGRGSALKTFTIGKHGSPWTPDQARTEAERLLALVTSGTDPAAEKRAREARGMSVADLCDRFMVQHVDEHTKPRTAREYGRLIEAIIKPRLGKLGAVDVSRADISALHHDLRKTPRQANLVLSVLSKMFNLSEAWGLRPDGSNPCRLVKRFKETARERFLTDAEMVGLGTALARLDEMRGENETVLNCIRLLLLTGCRHSEILNLRWADVNLADQVLVIREAKVEPRKHPIGSAAAALLATMSRESEWVLPGIRNKNKPLSIYTMNGAWARIRAGIGLSDVHLHDFRHCFGTAAGSTGANAFIIRDGLGHKTLAVTNRYVNRDMSPVRELANKVGNRFQAALDAGAAADRGEPDDKVVPLPKPGRRKHPAAT